MARENPPRHCVGSPKTVGVAPLVFFMWAASRGCGDVSRKWEMSCRLGVAKIAQKMLQGACHVLVTMNIESVAKTIKRLSQQHKSLLEKSRALFTDLDAHAESIIHHLGKIKDTLGISPNVCAICLEHPITFLVNPCSHCFCEDCATKCRAQRHCFLCRATVRNTQKIYLD